MFERSQIGLQLLQSNLESFLKVGITCASLQISGNIPLEMELLISTDRGSETISLATFRILVGILQRANTFAGVKRAYQITDFICTCKTYGKVF